MSFRNLIPLAHTALEYAQLGTITITVGGLTVIGDEGGHSGSGSQGYTELLAGDACGSYTSSDNTAGTKYFPDIKYFAGFKNYSINTSTNALIELEITANSITGDNIVKPNVSSDYNPDISPTSNYIHLFHGDEVFGRFDRIAIFKTANPSISGRLSITKGPSLN